MNYIGSKYKLCQDFLPSAIKSVCGNDLSQKVFCDIFAGTGIVGRTFRPLVKQIIANDIEYYSYVLNRNFIGNSIEIQNKESAIAELNSLMPSVKGFIYRNYCRGGQGERQYFSDINGMRIDACRQKVEEWKEQGAVSEDLYYFLICSIIECADKVANTASVYGAYLKHIKKTAQKDFVITPAEFIADHKKNKVYNGNANELIEHIEGDILYLDPPYNARQYGANYHLLNTIAEYKPFTPQGKTGLRKYYRSKYCSHNTVQAEFEQLIRDARFKFIFLSYNNEGLMSVDEVRNTMSRYGHYDLLQTDYHRFKADSNRANKSDSTIEYLHILEK